MCTKFQHGYMCNVTLIQACHWNPISNLGTPYVPEDLANEHILSMMCRWYIPVNAMCTGTCAQYDAIVFHMFGYMVFPLLCKANMNSVSLTCRQTSRYLFLAFLVPSSGNVSEVCWNYHVCRSIDIKLMFVPCSSEGSVHTSNMYMYKH